MPLPPFTEAGDLPSGVHRASIRELVGHLALGTPQRKAVGTRLTRVYELATATGAVDRFFVFGSFVTAKPEPNDVDVLLVMKDSFDLNRVAGQARLLFEHAAAQAYFGASGVLAAAAERVSDRTGGDRGVADQARWNTQRYR